jgi:threonine aldolase
VTSVPAGHVQWSSRPRIDLRWEVSVAPTDAMWEAMRATPIGMADFGEDPAVRELEAYGAELTGHEAALLIPTVTVGTVLSILGGAPRGSVVLMEERCHIYWVEQGHVASIAGAMPALLAGDKLGAIPVEAIVEAVEREHYGHRAPISMLCLENTHNICGGTVLSAGYTAAVAELCRRHGIKTYLDGARAFNAAVALGVPLRELTQPCDYVVVGLNKGLAAPFGSLLCGSREFIAEARRNCRALGAMGMHKAGLYAAAALLALRTMVDRLADDHRRARELAVAVDALPGLDVDLETVQTNLVRVGTAASGHTAAELAEGLAERGIAVHVFEPYAFKFALHLDITDAHVEEAVTALGEVMRELTAEPAVPPLAERSA